MRKATCAGVACLPLLFAGCGTACNFALAPFGVAGLPPGPAVYGGVQIDAAAASGFSANLRASTTGPNDYSAAGILGLMCTEFALSFVADTLTLPITIWLEARRNAAHDGTSDPGPSRAVQEAPNTAMRDFAKRNPGE